MQHFLYAQQMYFNIILRYDWLTFRAILVSFSREEGSYSTILQGLLKKCYVIKPAHSSYITALVSASYANALLTGSHIWQLWTSPQLEPLISIR